MPFRRFRNLGFNGLLPAIEGESRQRALDFGESETPPIETEIGVFTLAYLGDFRLHAEYRHAVGLRPYLIHRRKNRAGKIIALYPFQPVLRIQSIDQVTQ